MHGPTPYSVKWCLCTGIPNACQCAHALHAASILCLFFHNVTNKFKLPIAFIKKNDCKGNTNADLTFPYFILTNDNIICCKTFLHNCLHMSYLLLVMYLLFKPVFFNFNMFSKLASKSFDSVQFPLLREDEKHSKK